MLEVQNISKKFERNSEEFFAVKDISFKLDEGEFVAIVGKSGSGKSTLANMIAAFLTPSSGKIFFLKDEITAMNDEEASVYRNREIGYLPQVVGLLPNLTVEENVLLPFYLFDKKGDVREHFEYLLSKMKIDYLKEQFPSTLSAGEKKRVLFARSLINKPKLLIVDEPTANLDDETADEIMQLLYSLNSASILCITHDIKRLKEDTRKISMNMEN